MEYNYEFLLKLRISLKSIIQRAVNNDDFKAHNAAEKILLKIVLEEARIYIKEIESDIHPNDYAESEAWEYWVYDILEDDDVSLFLYSDLFISPLDNYKFDNWFKGIFLMEKWLVRSFKS